MTLRWSNGKYTVEYLAWANMIRRCTYPGFRQYDDYGGRGITVTDEWRGRDGFDRWLAEVGPRPSPKYTLDRMDNNKGYYPGNVRWATRVQQNRNTSKNVWLTANGVKKTLVEWSLERGIPQSTIRERLGLGWSEEKSVTTPSRPKAPKGSGPVSLRRARAGIPR